MNISHRLACSFICTFAALASFGCGGGSSTAELRLLDAPPPGVTSVKLSIAAMQVHVDDKSKTDADPNDASIDDDQKWHSLAVNKTIDLVLLQGETAAMVLGELPLPLGKITQLRLVIDTTKSNTAVLNGVECSLDTRKVAAKGIKINHVFKAFESKSGSRHQLWVDFRLDESLKPAGTCFELEPKLKLIRVKTDGKDETL